MAMLLPLIFTGAQAERGRLVGAVVSLGHTCAASGSVDADLVARHVPTKVGTYRVCVRATTVAGMAAWPGAQAALIEFTHD